MRYRINQIKLNMNEDHSDLADAVRRKLRKKKLEIYDIEIIRESVDLSLIHISEPTRPY